jgi:hypothetical protein
MKQLSDYNQNQTTQDLTRATVAGRYRTSDILPEVLAKQQNAYNLNFNNQVGQLGLQEATMGYNTQQQDKNYNWQTAMQFGGTNPYTGGSIQGNLPYQSEQSGIQREWEGLKLKQQWDAQAKMQQDQSNSQLWGSIFGGIGALGGGVLGGLFARGK